MRRLRSPAVVATVLAVVLLVTSCSGASPAVDVPEQDAGTSASADTGLPLVSLPAGTDGTVTVQETHDPVPRTDLVTARSSVVDVVVETQPPQGQGAEIRWPLPEEWQEGWEPVVVWEDGDGGWRWLPTERRAGPDGEVAVATTDHFSRGFLASFDPDGVAGDLLDSATDLFTGRAGAEVPVCEGSDQVGDLVEVVSDAVDGVGEGDAVLWCAGVEDGEPILRVTNNRRILAQVLVPTNADVIEEGRGISLTKGLAAIGASVEFFAQGLPQDRTVLLLEQGATVTVQLPRDERSGVEVSASGVGYLLSTLILGIDTYTTVVGAAGLDAQATPDRLLRFLGTGDGGSDDWLLAAVGCMRDFTDAYTDDLTAPVELGETMEDTFSMLVGCGMSLGAVSIDSSGPLGWIVSATVSSIAGLLSVVVTALELLVAVGREAIDALWGEEDAIYQVVTQPVAGPARSGDGSALVGTWSGPVDQSGAGPYGLEVTFTGSGAGLGAEVAYPELSCTGRWELEEVTDDGLLFVETITDGSRCVTTLDVLVRPSAGQLLVEGQPPYVFTAVLTPGAYSGAEGGDGPGWPTDRDDAPGGLYAWIGAASITGNVSIGYPDWTSCLDSTDVCLASDGDVVSVIERGAGGFYEAATVPLGSPARRSLVDLGYTEREVEELLAP